MNEPAKKFKTCLFAGLLTIQVIMVSGQATVSVNDRYYEAAYEEITGMLDGDGALDLKRAVYLLEWAYLRGELDYEWFCGEIARAAVNLESFISLNGLDRVPEGGNIALFEYFTNPSPLNGYRPYLYDFEDFRGDKDYTMLFVSKLLRTGSGQCRSLPLLYKILANVIGAEAYIAYAPEHSFIRHPDGKGGWTNVELTNHSLPREIFIIESMGITQRAIDKGVYMKPCGDREIVINLLVDLTSGFIHKYGYMHQFIYKCIAKVVENDPDNLRALMLLHNDLRTEGLAWVEYLQENGLPLTDEYKRHWMMFKAVEKDIDELGYTDMPQHLYDEWVRAMEEEKVRRERGLQ